MCDIPGKPSVSGPRSWGARWLAAGLIVGSGLLPPGLASAAPPPAEVAAPARPAGVPEDATLESQGARIGTILIVRHNVFDTRIAAEDKALFRAANRIHVVTREEVIREQLLISTGQAYSRRLLDESARLLRAQPYLHDAQLRPVRYADGVVDIEVETRDNWSLNPGVSGGTKGGASSFGIELEESNLLGSGTALSLSHRSNSDRNENLLRFRDDHLFGPWRGLNAQVNSNSDGSGWALGIEQPFHALDSRRGWGLQVDRLTLVEPLYTRGDKVSEFRQRNRDVDAWWGWSLGLADGHVRRYSLGYRDLQRDFLPSRDPDLVGPQPVDRHLAGPWVGIESIRDDWAALRNYDQIGITEDFLLGTRWAAKLGRADQSFGGGQDAWWLEAEASRGIRLPQRSLLRLDSNFGSRWEDGSARDLTLGGSARFYRETGRHRLFFATLEGQYGHALDLDGRPTLGGDTGLRGYPQRWAGGESYARLSVEQRYFTDWYPWRLFRVGGAIFVDVGRTWGEDPLGAPNPGTMADIGVGLRLSNSRSAFARIIHVDVAIPIDSDPELKNVQFLVEARKEF